MEDIQSITELRRRYNAKLLTDYEKQKYIMYLPRDNREYWEQDPMVSNLKFLENFNCMIQK